jgi:hypothetical protein
MGKSSVTSKLDEILLRVGDGRGFVVAPKPSVSVPPGTRYVITAAHCLPHYPPRASTTYTAERTYQRLLAPLGKGRRVWAECLFVDPVADIAALATPDTQELFAEAEAYERLVESLTPFSVSDLDATEVDGQLLPLTGEPFACRVSALGNGPLWISGASDGVRRGMSGSPILNTSGAAIGVVVTGERMAGDDSNRFTESGPNPRLAAHLPGWLLADLGLKLNQGPLREHEQRFRCPVEVKPPS